MSEIYRTSSPEHDSFRGPAVLRAIRTCRAIPLIALLLLVHCFAAGLAAAEERDRMGKFEGTVSTQDAASRTYVTRAKVQVSGPVTVQTETDSEGRFAVAGVPAGTYTLTPALQGWGRNRQ